MPLHDVRLAVEHLDREQWLRLMRTVQESADEPEGIRALGGAIATDEDGGLDVADTVVYGWGRGARTLLCDFLPTLSASCRRVVVDLTSVEHDAFRHLADASARRPAALTLRGGAVSTRGGHVVMRDVTATAGAEGIEDLKQALTRVGATLGRARPAGEGPPLDA